MVDVLIDDDGQEELVLESEDNLNESPVRDESDEVGEPEDRPDIIPSSLGAKIFFALFLLLYLLLAVARIDDKYVDFGDGNYLYLSWRMSEGDLLYRDLPSPQPPLLLLLGQSLLTLSGGDAITVRLWQVIQHALVACCVWGIAGRVFLHPWMAAVAGGIFLFLPEGVWWSAGYQSEPLLILLQSFNVLLLLNAVRNPKASLNIYATAFVGAMTCYVNMTALPYLALQWFFVWFSFRPLFWRYSLGVVVPGLLMFVAMLVYSHGQYLEHVFARQIGTYPGGTLWAMLEYFIYKLQNEGGDILFYEGGFVFASMAGILLFSNDHREMPEKDYLIWWGIFSLGSIIFVTKGGTVEYIFTIGEPAVAVFAAYFLVTFWMATGLSLRIGRILTSANLLGRIVLLVCLILPAMLMKPVSMLSRTLGNYTANFEQNGYLSNKVFELSGEQMERVGQYIQYQCPPNKLLVSPPYYAFYAKRQLSENASSLLILYAAYFHEWERFEAETDYGIDLPDLSQMREARFKNNRNTAYRTQEIVRLAELFKTNKDLQERYPIIQTFLAIREDIHQRRVGLVLADEHHMFFWVPILQQAIRDYCRPASPSLDLPSREEVIVAYVPK